MPAARHTDIVVTVNDGDGLDRSAAAVLMRAYTLLPY
jgi:hypothetical protein